MRLVPRHLDVPLSSPPCATGGQQLTPARFMHRMWLGSHGLWASSVWVRSFVCMSAHREKEKKAEKHGGEREICARTAIRFVFLMWSPNAGWNRRYFSPERFALVSIMLTWADRKERYLKKKKRIVGNTMRDYHDGCGMHNVEVAPKITRQISPTTARVSRYDKQRTYLDPTARSVDCSISFSSLFLFWFANG